MVNTDGCAEKYQCEISVYLRWIFAHTYNIIIDHGVGSPVNGREVVDDLNGTEKKCLLMLMTTVKLPGAASYETQMPMHNSTVNTGIIVAKEFYKHLP